jgi:hypothetical protein
MSDDNIHRRSAGGRAALIFGLLNNSLKHERINIK